MILTQRVKWRKRRLNKIIMYSKGNQRICESQYVYVEALEPRNSLWNLELRTTLHFLRYLYVSQYETRIVYMNIHFHPNAILFSYHLIRILDWQHKANTLFNFLSLFTIHQSAINVCNKQSINEKNLCIGMLC